MAEYHTETNLYLAAYVTATSGQLPAVSVDHKGRARFDFQDDEGTVAWPAQAWHLDKGLDDAELTVGVKQFCNALNKLKYAMGDARKQAGIYAGAHKTSRSRKS